MSLEYFVPGLWPKKRINLICGASGSGKTTWIIPQLVALHKAGTKILYTCCDRTIEDAQDTLEHLGYPGDILPMVSFQNSTDETDFSLDGLYTLGEGREHDILFIEAMTNLAGDPNSAKDVCNFGRRLNRYTRLTGASIWGSCWATKTKENDKFARTRDNVMGSAAWSGICGTVVYIEANNGETSPERRVTILPRHGAPVVENYRFSPEGRLERFTPATMDGQLSGASGIVTTADIEGWAEAAGVSRASAHRWINRTLEAGKLDFVARGRYRVC